MTDYTNLIERLLRIESKVVELIAERDEYQQAADKMAAEHKVERDQLQAENERLDKENTDLLVILATAIQHRDGFRKQLNDLRHEMDDLEGQCSDLQDKYDCLQSDIEGAYGVSANP